MNSTPIFFVSNILKIKTQTDSLKSFYFKFNKAVCDLNQIIPGQFFLLRLLSHYSLGEKPFSVSNVDIKNNIIEFTVKAIGPFTNAFLKKSKINDQILFRGPFGNGFSINNFFIHRKNVNLLLIGGGIGIAPLKFFLHWIGYYNPENLSYLCNNPNFNVNIKMILGAKSAQDIPFLQNFLEDKKKNIVIYTEDNSPNTTKGIVTSNLFEFIKKYKINQVVAVGPSKMLFVIKKILDNSFPKVYYQFSIENYVSCGIGLCGSCIINVNNSALRICTDGPVFDKLSLENWIPDFNQSKNEKNIGLNMDKIASVLNVKKRKKVSAKGGYFGALQLAVQLAENVKKI